MYFIKALLCPALKAYSNMCCSFKITIGGGRRLLSGQCLVEKDHGTLIEHTVTALIEQSWFISVWSHKHSYSIEHFLGGKPTDHNTEYLTFALFFHTFCTS